MPTTPLATSSVSTRRTLGAALVTGTAIRLWLAATTYGSDDVHTFARFAEGARRAGPWRIYDVDFGPGYLYNHGPLTSWLLVLLARVHDLGVSFPLLIRLPATIADVVSTLLVFALVRDLRGERSALLAAGLFTLAPAAWIVAGYHGNTDPVFVMFVLLAAWLHHRGRPGWQVGAAFALALSIKIVPVVVLPILLSLALRRSRRSGVSFVAGGAAVFGLLWLPVLLVAPTPFLDHVLGYTGIDVRQWGLSQLASWAGASLHAVVVVGNALRLLVVALAAAAPFVVRRRRPATDPVVLVLAPLAVFLLLSPAFSLQYLVWALAATLVCVPVRWAAPFVVLSSAYALAVYSDWSDAPPWSWQEARSTPVPDSLLPLMIATWLALGVVVWRACLAPAAGITQSVHLSTPLSVSVPIHEPIHDPGGPHVHV